MRLAALSKATNSCVDEAQIRLTAQTGAMSWQPVINCSMQYSPQKGESCIVCRTRGWVAARTAVHQPSLCGATCSSPAYQQSACHALLTETQDNRPTQVVMLQKDVIGLIMKNNFPFQASCHAPAPRYQQCLRPANQHQVWAAVTKGLMWPWHWQQQGC